MLQYSPCTEDTSARPQAEQFQGMIGQKAESRRVSCEEGEITSHERCANRYFIYIYDSAWPRSFPKLPSRWAVVVEEEGGVGNFHDCDWQKQWLAGRLMNKRYRRDLLASLGIFPLQALSSLRGPPNI